MATERDDRRLIAGTMLIVLGIVLLAGRFRNIFDWQFGGFWPVLLVVFGGLRLWTTWADERRGTGLMALTAGVLLLLHTQEVVGLRASWPLFVVAGGIGILLRAWGRPAAPPTGGQS